MLQFSWCVQILILKNMRDSTYVFSFFIERMSPHLKASDF